MYIMGVDSACTRPASGRRTWAAGAGEEANKSVRGKWAVNVCIQHVDLACRYAGNYMYDAHEERQYLLFRKWLLSTFGEGICRNHMSKRLECPEAERFGSFRTMMRRSLL